MLSIFIVLPYLWLLFTILLKLLLVMSNSELKDCCDSIIAMNIVYSHVVSFYT